MEITAVLFGAVLLVVAVWSAWVLISHYRVREHPERFPEMAGRLGLSLDDIRYSDVALHLPTAERLCLVCNSTEECDEWLAIGVGSPCAPRFCPNAGYLSLLRQPRHTPG